MRDDNIPWAIEVTNMQAANSKSYQQRLQRDEEERKARQNEAILSAFLIYLEGKSWWDSGAKQRLITIFLSRWDGDRYTEPRTSIEPDSTPLTVDKAKAMVNKATAIL